MGYNLANCIENAAALRHVSPDFLFNKLFGELPKTIRFPGRETNVLEKLLPHFELVSAIYGGCGRKVTKVENIYIDQGMYVGKEGTPFERCILGVHLESRTGFQAGMAAFYGEEDAPELPPSQEVDLDMGNFDTNIHFAVPLNFDMTTLIDLVGGRIVEKPNLLYMLVQSYGELVLQPIDMQGTEGLDIALNYGEDFVEKDEYIVDCLNKINSGLYLFYGAPGTGKSTYIRKLLNGDIKRKIAYVPVGLIDSLTSPEMLPLLMGNKGLILVIEDAEKALLARNHDQGNSSLVSAVLNLTDGFIGSALGVSVIATFNTDREKIDAALLRQGRLKASHEFELLSKENAQKLIDHLGKQFTATDPMSLAEIYNLDAPKHGIQNEDKVIVGFGKA